MVNINKIAPLPWNTKKLNDIPAYCVLDNNGKVVIPLSAMIEKEIAEYIVESANEHHLLKETCKKLVDQDTNNFEDMRKISYINTLVGETNQLLREEGDKLKIKLQMAITFLKTIDTKDAQDMIDTLKEGFKIG